MTFASTFLLKMAGDDWPRAGLTWRIDPHVSRAATTSCGVAPSRPASAARRSRAQRVADKGQLLVRDRLRLLLDDEPDFEDGLLARANDGLPGDAVVTVVGKVDGRTTCIIANDYTVKAGTWGRRTFEKITRMQELADQIGAPLVYLVDAAGARIDEQFDSYAGRRAWGNIFYNQIAYSGRVPQVCALFGPSPAGSAYVPALCDVTIMVRGHATAYLGSPRLAEMVTGEQVSLEEMGGAEMHCRVSGVGDVLVDTTRRRSPPCGCGCRTSRRRGTASRRRPRAGLPAPHRPIEEIVPAREDVPFDMQELIDGDRRRRARSSPTRTCSPRS